MSNLDEAAGAAMKYRTVYNTPYGVVRIERLEPKEVDGYDMERYRLSWTEGGGRHSMEVVLDGLAGEMMHGLLKDVGACPSREPA